MGPVASCDGSLDAVVDIMRMAAVSLEFEDILIWENALYKNGRRVDVGIVESCALDGADISVVY